MFGILENIGLHGFEAKIRQKIIPLFLSLWSRFLYCGQCQGSGYNVYTHFTHDPLLHLLAKSSFTSHGVWCRSQGTGSMFSVPHYTLIGVTWPSSGDVISSFFQLLPYMGRAATWAGWAGSISLYGHERGEQPCDTDCQLFICDMVWGSEKKVLETWHIIHRWKVLIEERSLVQNLGQMTFS